MPFSLRCNLRFGSRCDLRPSPALVSQPPRQINTKAPPHTIHSARAHNTQAHPHRNTRAAALEHGQDNPPRDQLGRQPLRDQGHQPTNRRCAPGPAGSHACIVRCFRSALPLRARARETGAHAAGAHAHARAVRSRACPNYVPAEARRPPRDAQLALPIGTCERAASPVLLTACALLPRCRQPQLRAVGLDGHRTLDISATTSRRDVDSTVMMIRPPSRPRSPARPRRREACRLCNVADGDGVGPNHARSAGAVGAARRHDVHPVGRAHCHRAQRVRVLIAAPPPGCIPLPALTHACSTTSARACFIMAWALSPAPLPHLHLQCTHHTHVTACHTRSALQLQRPCPN